MKLLDCTKGKRLLIANHLDQSMKQYLIASCAQMQCKSHITTAPTLEQDLLLILHPKTCCPVPPVGVLWAIRGIQWMDGALVGRWFTQAESVKLPLTILTWPLQLVNLEVKLRVSFPCLPATHSPTAMNLVNLLGKVVFLCSHLYISTHFERTHTWPVFRGEGS